MSVEDRCCFCRRLPPVRGRRPVAAVAARCPVCRGGLVRTPDGTYRDDGDSATGDRWPRRRAACALGGVAVLIAVGGLLSRIPTSTAPRPTAAAAVPVAQARPTTPPAPAVVELVGPPKEALAAVTALPLPPRVHAVTQSSSPPLAPAKAVAAAMPPASARTPDPEPLVADVRPPVALPPWHAGHSATELTAQLRRVPEVSVLAATANDAAAMKAAWREMEKAARTERERFLDGLVTKRPELSGLPFRKGKECELDRAAAHALNDSSRAVRTALTAADRGIRSHESLPDSDAVMAAAAFQVYHELIRNPRLGNPKALPGIDQVLSGEPAAVRLGLVNFLQAPPDLPAAAAVLTRRAVFDTSAAVRQAAVGGLHALEPKAYLSALLNGLRHPWPAADEHAAEALVALRADSAVPDLIRVLDAPDPCAPFEVADGGTKAWAVREVVRVNHHANCLLCHPPSFAANDLVRGPVPDPFLPLPVNVPYYGDRSSTRGLSVRADVTYLRQDFSEVLPVEHAGPWPKEQRFDFLVRTRRLTAAEAQEWLNRGQVDGAMPASRRAALYALRQLTGLDGGETAASWERALAARSGSK